MNWLWPRQLNSDDRVIIRIVRLAHWSIVGLAAFASIMSFIGLIEAGDQEPLSYFAVAFVWLAVAMLGRGVRYVIARE